MTRAPWVDVVVVGGRAAGSATALLLARAGARVVVVERDRPGTDTLSTHALMRGAVAQLARWGLLDEVRAAGTPAISQTVFHYPADTVPVAIKPGAGVDALYAPRRTVLDPILAAAGVRAGADLRYRTAVVGLELHRGRVRGVRVLERGTGLTYPIRASLVIGADGRRSTVARLTGAPTTYRARHTSAFSYCYVAGLPAVGYEWAYGDGTAGFIPTNDGLTCVFAGHRPDRVGRGGPEVLRRLVAAASPALGQRLALAEPASPVRTFTGLPGFLRRPWGPGWALVGDAGSWKDPISAHGLTDALRDAELLARAALAELDGGAPAAGYRGYERERDRFTVPILRDADEIAAMDWDGERVAALLRQLNLAMNEELLSIAGLDDAVVRGPAGSLATGTGG